MDRSLRQVEMFPESVPASSAARTAPPNIIRLFCLLWALTLCVGCRQLTPDERDARRIDRLKQEAAAKERRIAKLQADRRQASKMDGAIWLFHSLVTFPSNATFMVWDGKGFNLDAPTEIFAQHLQHVLAPYGWHRVHDATNATFVVGFRWQSSHEDLTRVESSPVFGTLNSGFSQFNITTFSSGAPTTQTGTIQTAPTTGIVGTRQKTVTDTIQSWQLSTTIFDVSGRRDGREPVNIFQSTSRAATANKFPDDIEVVAGLFDATFASLPGTPAQRQFITIFPRPPQRAP